MKKRLHFTLKTSHWIIDLLYLEICISFVFVELSLQTFLSNICVLVPFYCHFTGWSFRTSSTLARALSSFPSPSRVSWRVGSTNEWTSTPTPHNTNHPCLQRGLWSCVFDRLRVWAPCAVICLPLACIV